MYIVFEWAESAKIEKIDGGKTIKISTEKNSLSLELNDEKTEVNLTINDNRTGWIHCEDEEYQAIHL